MRTTGNSGDRFNQRFGRGFQYKSDSSSTITRDAKTNQKLCTAAIQNTYRKVKKNRLTVSYFLSYIKSMIVRFMNRSGAEDTTHRSSLIRDANWMPTVNVPTPLQQPVHPPPMRARLSPLRPSSMSPMSGPSPVDWLDE